jgi:hypothetical protein
MMCGSLMSIIFVSGVVAKRVFACGCLCAMRLKDQLVQAAYSSAKLDVMVLCARMVVTGQMGYSIERTG